MDNSEEYRYKPTKIVLYQIVPKIISGLRVPGLSDGTAGRRLGEPNLDEMSGAADILYHLMSNESVAIMSEYLNVPDRAVYDAIDLALHSIEKKEKQ